MKAKKSVLYSIINDIAFVDEQKDIYPQIEEQYELSKVSQTVCEDEDLEMFSCEEIELATDLLFGVQNPETTDKIQYRCALYKSQLASKNNL